MAADVRVLHGESFPSLEFVLTSVTGTWVAMTVFAIVPEEHFLCSGHHRALAVGILAVHTRKPGVEYHVTRWSPVRQQGVTRPGHGRGAASQGVPAPCSPGQLCSLSRRLVWGWQARVPQRGLGVARAVH